MGTLCKCFKSLLKFEKVLHTIVSRCDCRTCPKDPYEKRQSILATIMDNVFINTLEQSIAIMKPLDALIKYFQKDTIPVSEIY